MSAVFAASTPNCSAAIRRPRAGVVDPFGAAAPHHLARRRPVDRDAHALVAPALPGDRGEHEVIALAQQDHDAARLDERSPALDDQLEDAIELDVGTDGQRDRLGRLQAADGALELAATLFGGVVQAGVVRGDPGPAREHDDRLLVGLVEFAAALLGEVQVAPDLAADEHRHAEEAVHRRMARGEPIRAMVLADPRQAQRSRVLDEDPEHPPPAREIADRPRRVVVDASRDEALELGALAVEHADRGVASAGQLAGRLEYVAEHGIELELGDDEASDVDQRPQAIGFERFGNSSGLSSVEPLPDRHHNIPHPSGPGPRRSVEITD